MTSDVLHAVLGTAGHIDHGKSSLVRALTGTDPDRFKEERDRGMTIDLGFAEWRAKSGVDVGLIDVPGHERFVRNMVAGASGMDCVMLVVAADDGVMPQTREHLEIMQILGLERGFVVLTKVDLVEEELVELAEEEVREFLQGTFLGEAPIVRFSAPKKRGLEEVEARIEELVASLPARPAGGVFRMPVQRSFTLKGHGTILTGVPVSGEVAPGDTLEVLPRGVKGRVRSLQVHHRPAERARAGHRTAVNLSDVNWRDVQRGDVLARPGYFRPSALLEARFRLLPSWKGPFRNQLPIRFHVGTAEVLGRVVLLDQRSLAPGEDALVQLRLDEPVVCAAGDPYLLRLASPERTLGGGLVLGETRFRHKRFREWIQENLRGKEESLGDPERYLEYVLRAQGLAPVHTDDLAAMTQSTKEEVRARLDTLAERGRVQRLKDGKQLLHLDMVAHGAEQLRKVLGELHDENRYAYGFGLPAIASRLERPLEAAEAFLERARQEGGITTKWGLHRLDSHGGSLSKEDRRILDGVESVMLETGFQAPIPADLAEQLGKPRKRVDQILQLLDGWGRVLRLDDNVHLHVEAVQRARDLVVAHCEEKGRISTAEVRDLLQTSRKYAIPLLERFDRLGLTEREDSERRLANGYENVHFVDPEERDSALGEPADSPPAN